ncbi:MAG: DNA translocase FtsK [Pirellulales bacterium]|nr:DNA translocase FtsK [Pirellulales bacterium]
MLEQRDLRLDLLALAVLALTVFLAASLLSYDPADPPGTIVYPPAQNTLNVCGRSGAWVSMVLLEAFGLGAYYLLVSLIVVVSLMLARHRITEPYLRLSGWLLSLAGFCTLAAMAVPQFSPGPVIGSGGYLGATGRGLLEMNFASVGAYILITSIILGGLLLCTDYVLIRFLAWMVGMPTKAAGRGLVQVAAAYAGNLAAKRAAAEEENAEEEEEEEEDEDEDEEEDEEPLAVRGPGRKAEEAADSEKTEEPNEKPSPDEAPAAKSPQPLKIRKPKKSQREEMIEEIEATASGTEPSDYELPAVDLLLESEPFRFEEHEKEVRRRAKILEKTFADFGFNIRVVEIQTGPVIAQFEVELEAGLRLSKITGLADDLAIALRVPSVRIVAPIPGKNTVGIEVPNTERQLVRLREVMDEGGPKAQTMRIPIFLGKDVSGNPMIVDLASLPHLLIAGRTGTGKSVCLNSIIVSMLMTRRPDEVRMLLVDPKMVELSPYKQIPHLMHPVVTDMRKAEAILAWAVEKMEERYQLLARAGVRHLSVYNQLGEEELRERIQPEDEQQWAEIPKHMPYIVIVADEMADLMMTAAKEVEGHIIRLAQKSRAVGIHLVLATQKPTVDVITGLIKSNLPARICFEVASRTDSRVVLDEMGADKLLGNGDMLFLWPGTSSLIRGQGTYLSDDEITRVIGSVATSEPQFVKELVQLKTAEVEGQGPQLNSKDELYEAAVDLVVREGRGSVSLLQRGLGIGYGRAARLIDFMSEDGIVGPYNGSQAREVMISVEDWDAMRGAPASQAAPAPVAASAPKRPSNRIRLEPASSEPGPKPGRRTAAAPAVSRPSGVKSRAREEEDDEFDEVPFDERPDEELEEDDSEDEEEDDSVAAEEDDAYDEDEEVDEEEEIDEEVDEYEEEDDEAEEEDDDSRWSAEIA